MAKITQTAGRNALGEFAPQFAHFNDDVLFGENWNRIYPAEERKRNNGKLGRQVFNEIRYQA